MEGADAALDRSRDVVVADAVHAIDDDALRAVAASAPRAVGRAYGVASDRSAELVGAARRGRRITSPHAARVDPDRREHEHDAALAVAARMCVLEAGRSD